MESPHSSPSFAGAAPGGSHATSASYLERRAWIGEYFDRTAAAAWKALTSDAPVSRVRRDGAGRTRDACGRRCSASLPESTGRRAGARRRVRHRRAGHGPGPSRGVGGGHRPLADAGRPCRGRCAESQGLSVDFRSGDMLDPALGSFDYAIAMDSLIHYELREILGAAVAASRRGWRTACSSRWRPGRRCWRPCTRSESCSRAVTGRRPSCRWPSAAFRRGVSETPALAGWTVAGTKRVERGFYRSQAVVLQNEGFAKGAIRPTGSIAARAD